MKQKTLDFEELYKHYVKLITADGVKYDHMDRRPTGDAIPLSYFNERGRGNADDVYTNSISFRDMKELWLKIIHKGVFLNFRFLFQEKK